MGFVKLDLPCAKSSPLAVSPDPEPHWTLDDLLSEINSLEKLLGARFSAEPSPLRQPDSVFSKKRELGDGKNKPFVMYVSDDDSWDTESESEENADLSLVPGGRFSCNDLNLSDSDEADDDLHNNAIQPHLMERRGLEEGILFELECEHRLNDKEHIRKKLTSWEVKHRNEIEKLIYTMDQLEKYAESRRELDKKLDKHYLRKIAEVLDRHLSAVQRDHEQRSQIMERRIRDDAALEEAKRREKAIIEEKIQQERAKQEAEARQKAAKLAEDAQRAALEAAKKEAAKKEAAKKHAAGTKEKSPSEVDQKQALELSKQSSIEGTTELKKKDVVTDKGQLHNQHYNQLLGVKVFAANAALETESRRLKLNNDVPGNSCLTKDFDRYDRRICNSFKKLVPTVESVKARAEELIKFINDPGCPRSISIYFLANKLVSLCRDSDTPIVDKYAFACGYVMLLVASKIPEVMDFVVAEFHKVWIYTVPKHLQLLGKSRTREEFRKMIGYREKEKGKIESDEDYWVYVGSYMKLYAAIIQTEIEGIRNPLGLREGWKWLATFLNALPANKSTAVALESFLEMAGFALHRRYRAQFMKILDIITGSFLPALKKQGTGAVVDIVTRLEHYLNNKKYLMETEGRLLGDANSILSGHLF